MIAEINGVRVEGTPEEVAEYQRLATDFIKAKKSSFFGEGIVEKLIPIITDNTFATSGKGVCYNKKCSYDSSFKSALGSMYDYHK